ncbi:hypothetical protein U0070_019582, partial [Myodes glareolus]
PRRRCGATPCPLESRPRRPRVGAELLAVRMGSLGALALCLLRLLLLGLQRSPLPGARAQSAAGTGPSMLESGAGDPCQCSLGAKTFRKEGKLVTLMIWKFESHWPRKRRYVIRHGDPVAIQVPLDCLALGMMSSDTRPWIQVFGGVKDKLQLSGEFCCRRVKFS